MTTAVILVPNEHIEQFAYQCYQYCIAMEYDVAGIVRGDWDAAFHMLLDHTADVLVVARPEHVADVDTDHIGPRIEFAVPPDPEQTRRDERHTRIIRPGEAT